MKGAGFVEKHVIFDGMYGLAVADALGVPYESESLESMRQNPCTGMTGYGHHRQPAGSWSDDTSMSLCVADSLSCKGFDPDDQMRRFTDWRLRQAYTANHVVFDVGRSCRRAINQYWDGVPAEFCGDRSVNGNGNGALMRMFPMALYQCHLYQGGDEHLADFLGPIHTASAITHAHAIGEICCGLFALTLREWLNRSAYGAAGKTLQAVIGRAFEKGMAVYRQMEGDFREHLPLFLPPEELKEKSADDLPSWGYALNSWHIALWSLLNTDNYRDCVLKAVNVGGDTDTNAAVAGALAGVIYGRETIPAEWVEALLNRELIDGICEKFNQKVLGIAGEKTVIDAFAGEYAFLSMKTPSEVRIGTRNYPNTAVASYALCVQEADRAQFETLDIKRARKLYASLPHDERGEEQLYTAVKARFDQHPEERRKLAETAPLEIIYDTSGSHDNVLGRCRCQACQGKDYLNLYGKALMRVRDEITSGDLKG